MPKNGEKCQFYSIFTAKKGLTSWRADLGICMYEFKCHFVIIQKISGRNSFLANFYQKMPFLWWFTTFYGIQIRPHICATFCNCDVSVSQAPIPLFWHFASKSHSFWEADTEKMVKNLLLTANYGIESFWMMTFSLNSLQICVSVLDQHCLTNCWPQPSFLSEFNWTKWSKMPFLRLFTAFYGIFSWKSQ